jgi:hypothetical protein
MTLRSALAGAATTVVVVGALGNPAAVDAARDSDEQVIATTLTGFPNWDVADAAGEVVGLVALRLGVLIVLTGVLCGLVGRSRSRVASWLGGWGAVTVAAAVAGGLAYVYQVSVILDGRAPTATYLDGLVQAANGGASFGLWTGWLVGLVVAVATRPAPAGAPVTDAGFVAGEPRGAAAPPPIAEPPLPWWAPTYAADAGVRPGPTAFPPGGHAEPVAAGGGVPVTPAPPSRAPTHDMRTATGDPHPSDPDATEAVGFPHEADAAEARPSAQPVDGPPDPDATTTMSPDPAVTDPTAEMPRRPDR